MELTPKELKAWLEIPEHVRMDGIRKIIKYIKEKR